MESTSDIKELNWISDHYRQLHDIEKLNDAIKWEIPVTAFYWQREGIVVERSGREFKFSCLHDHTHFVQASRFYGIKEYDIRWAVCTRCQSLEPGQLARNQTYFAFNKGNHSE